MTLIDAVRVTAGSRIPITIDFGIDLSGYETKEFKVWKPDGTTATWAPEVYETTKLRYTTGDYDLPAADAGEWRLLPRSSRWGGLTNAVKEVRAAVRELKDRLDKQSDKAVYKDVCDARQANIENQSKGRPGRFGGAALLLCTLGGVRSNLGARGRGSTWYHGVPWGTSRGLAQPRGETLSRA